MNIKKILTKGLDNQIIRYLFVGFAVTIFHNGLYHLLMVNNSFSSTLNNFLVFCLSVQLSFFSHRFLTFRNPDGVTTFKSFLKFLTTASSNLVLASLVSYIFIDQLNFHHYYFIAFSIIILPFISFILMKTWVFKKNE